MEPCKNIVDEFIEWLRLQSYSASTLLSYPMQLKRFFALLSEKKIIIGQSIDVAAITPEVMEDYQEHLYDYIQPGRNTSLAPVTQSSLLSVVLVFCRFLVATKRLAQNPADGLALFYPGTRRGRNPSEELKKLLSATKTKTAVGFRDRVIFEMIRSTGMRPVELVRLVPNDFKLEQGLVVYRRRKKTCVGKLDQTAMKWLRLYLLHVRPYFIQTLGVSSWFFVGRKGRCIHQGGVERKLRFYKPKEVFLE